VQLAARDLNPASRFNVSAAGFAAKERLTLTVKDVDGVSYDAGTLTTGADGAVRNASVALPTGLASGGYQLVIEGDTSHRSASATFQMHDTPPGVKLDVYYGVPGQQFGFAGNGFFPGEKVQVFLGPGKTPLTTVTATDAGAVNGRLGIPPMAAGSYTFSLVGEQSQTPASVAFNIQGFAPWVVMNRWTLTPGETEGFIGYGFAPGEQVFVYLNSTQGDPALQLTADTAGQVVEQPTWDPSAQTGDNTITLVGQSSRATATATFKVLQGAAPPPPAGP
jgi:hypothetical protein